MAPPEEILPFPKRASSLHFSAMTLCSSLLCFRTLFLLLAFLGLGRSDVAQASPVAGVPQLSGRYTFAGTETERQQISDAIEESIGHLNFFLRPLARSRLRMLTEPADWFTFTARPGVLQVVNPLVQRPCRLDGEKVEFTDRRGKTSQAICHPKGAGIEEEFSLPDNGQWKHSFIPAHDGQTVIQTVFVNAPQLAKPIAFQLTYVKGSKSP